MLIFVLLNGFMFYFLIRECKRLKNFQLIADNSILHITSAQLFKTEDISLQNKGMEIFISCFGILLDSKIIKFNIDGIQLKNIEIDNIYISFEYGTKNYTQKIKILHEAIGEQELNNIVKMFYFETGVAAKIIDKK